MTSLDVSHPITSVPVGVNRRSEARSEVCGDLWMVDHFGSTVLQCHCMDASGGGLRLRVPLGYGVAAGQRYELRSHLPGKRAAPGFGVVGSRWATVVWTEVELGHRDDHLAVGVVLDPADSALTWSVTAGEPTGRA